MYYHSTRNNNGHYTASEAILKGLADDGGLFVPGEIPNIANKLGELAKLSYAKLCHAVVCEFFLYGVYHPRKKRVYYVWYDYSNCI